MTSDNSGVKRSTVKYLQEVSIHSQQHAGQFKKWFRPHPCLEKAPEGFAGQEILEL